MIWLNQAASDNYLDSCCEFVTIRIPEIRDEDLRKSLCASQGIVVALCCSIVLYFGTNQTNRSRFLLMEIESIIGPNCFLEPKYVLVSISLQLAVSVSLYYYELVMKKLISLNMKKKLYYLNLFQLYYFKAYYCTFNSKLWLDTFCFSLK